MQLKLFLQKSVKSFYILFALLTAFVAGCDMLDKDVINDQQQFSIRKEPIVITPKSSGIINLNSLILSSGNHRLAISSQPRLGELESLGDNLLQYTPNAGITEGRDQFGFSIFSDNNIFIAEDSVIIIITPDTTNHPCGLYAFDDYVADVDSVVVIDVLANDTACNVARSQLVVSHRPIEIYPNASFGAVEILDGGRIMYTPDTHYNGHDVVYYQVVKPANFPSQGDPEEVAYARVFINGPVPCDTIVAFNDYYSVNIDTVLLDSTPVQTLPLYDTLHLNITANDTWCSTTLPEISIIESPQGNLANYGFNPLIYFYTRPSSAVIGQNDRFRYRICKEGQCAEAEVVIHYK